MNTFSGTISNTVRITDPRLIRPQAMDKATKNIKSNNNLGYIFSISPSGKNIAIKYYDIGGTKGYMFISTDFGKTGTTVDCNGYEKGQNTTFNISDSNATPTILMTVQAGGAGGLSLVERLSPYTSSISTIIGNVSYITSAITSDISENMVLAFGNGATRVYNTTTRLEIKSFSFSQRGCQISSTPAGEYTLISYYEDLITPLIKFKLLTSKFRIDSTPTALSNISSIYNGLVYVSVTGSFMAIMTNTTFYFSRDKFQNIQSISSGDIYTNFFFVDFSGVALNVNHWLAYNESTQIAYFIRNTAPNVGFLYKTSDFSNSTIMPEPIEVSVRSLKSTYQTGFTGNTNCSLFVSSANAEYFLVYGTYLHSLGMFYIKNPMLP